MKSIAFDQYAAFVGIDWADRKHDVCLQVPDVQRPEFSVIEHTPQAIETWALGLLKRFGSGPIAVACELRKGPLVYALAKYPHLVIFPLNPAAVAQHRKAFYSSGAKDDPTDAELQCDMLQRHFSRFKPLLPDSPAMRSLQQLVEYRRSCVADRVRVTNRITSALKNYYPQPLEWFDSTSTLVFCDFLKRWPTLDCLARVRTATFERFFHQHNVRGAARIDARIASIRNAMPLTSDPGVIEANTIVVQTQLELLRVLLKTIRQLDGEIAAICKTHTDHDIFASFPGAGAVFSARLLAAFGDNRKRYTDAGQLQT